MKLQNIARHRKAYAKTTTPKRFRTPCNAVFKLAVAKGILSHTTNEYPMQNANAIIPVTGTKFPCTNPIPTVPQIKLMPMLDISET
mmetsp:Transcript_53820/g.79996  ORF Transcript_53820/g.79996 Transcript_53820/m.79996 type:complete len:86 (+) Transcript_53820:1191-1448(+)